jgi:uncharacterized protein YndB with AHSA1/START domain
MRRLTFRIEIDAPRSRVWSAMLDDATYRDWCSEFSPGSHFEGDWGEGSRIRFVGPGENGDGGIVSRVRANRLHEYVELEHIGVVREGREDTTSDVAHEWAGAHESYTFTDAGGKTELLVKCDTTEEHEAMFAEMWPRALERLKAIAEAAG